LLASCTMTDSAIAVWTDLSTRYPIEASISARAAIQAGELLANEKQYDRARDMLERVIAAHPKDMLGGGATVTIGEAYLAESNWTQALQTLTAARHDFTLAPESQGRAFFGLAKANEALSKKAEAIRDLRAMLEVRGLPETQRANAETLLRQLAPAAKQKLSKPAKANAKPNATKKPVKKAAKKGGAK
jgi:tetratricopeptide (TPR) repeat protein